MRSVVENHFNKVMEEISQGLPSVPDDFEDEADFTFDGANAGGKWTCRTCQVKNDMKSKSCSTCKTAKPDFKFQGTRAVAKPGAARPSATVGTAKRKKFLGLF